MPRGAVAVAAGTALRCLRSARPLHPPPSWPLTSPSLHHRHRSHYSSSSTSQAPPSRKSKSRTFPLLIIGSVLGSTVYFYYSSLSHARPEVLNDQFFVPYRITAREVVSPTSFILTVSPHKHNLSLPYLLPGTHTWRFPQWSVEFKQPEVQIARHYTALPPREGDDELSLTGNGGLRFYVRAVGGGEMSSYIARLGVGSDVWLRGPHAGFDVLQRLGRNRDVVFLAGGTGIAPGMQVARAVLDGRGDSRVTLLWAVRRGSEVRGVREDEETVRPIPWWRFWEGRREPLEIGGDDRNAAARLDADVSPVTRQLREMEARYGSRLRIQISIDEEGSKFQEANLIKALTQSSPSTNSSNKINPHIDTGCQLHDPLLLQHASEFDELGTLNCSCHPASEQGSDDAPRSGKNLFIVSGPEGFVEHFAGPKNWFGGKQLQGPVGGVAARMQRRWPHLAQDWLVLKL